MLGSQVGTWMQSTAQSYLVWELTRSALATSLVTLVFSFPSTVLSLVGGVVADRVDRRRLVLVTQTVFLLQAVALTVLTFAGRIDRKSTRLNSSHTVISYAVFCLKKKK